MGKIQDLVRVYIDYRDGDPLAVLLEEHFPAAHFVRTAVSRRLVGLRKILGVGW